MLKNLSSNLVIASDIFVAKNFFEKAVGMIGKNFKSFDAYILPSCSSIHTWFMQMAIDLIYLDKNKKVLKTDSEVKPWRMKVGPPGTYFVIELPARHLCGIPTHYNDTLDW
jgi:uncharacterized membrane protein (UPF0127 family)